MAAPDIPVEHIPAEPAVCSIHVRDVWGQGMRREFDAEMAERLAGSFREFIPAAWSTVEPNHPFRPAWHIDAIASHLQAVSDGQITNLLINVSPGSAKSLIVSVLFPAWKWISEPGWRSLFSSYDKDLSSRDSMRCRDLLESVWYQETFRPTWKASPVQYEKTFYWNTEKGFRIATSVGGRGTGHRGDFLGVDDPINVIDQFSDTALENCISWWDTAWYNRLDPVAKHGARVVIMQRVSDRDLSGHLLRRGGWDHLVIPMEYDPSRSKVTSIGWRDPRTERGELMCPAVFSAEMVADIRKTQGEASYAGQYQQTPVAEGGSILKSHNWNYWQPPGANLPPVRVKLPDGSIQERLAVALPAHFDLTLMSWDLAFKDLKTSDFVCGQVHAVRGAHRFILKQVLRRMGIVDTMAAIREMSGDYPAAHLKLVEDKANGSAVIEMLQNDITGLVAVNPEGGKVARAQAAAPEQEAGNWHLPHPKIAAWVGNPENPTEGGFLAETTLFPFGANDDQCDAYTQGAIRIQTERLGGEFSISDQDVRVDQFEIDAKWPRLYALAIDWREFGSVWIARKPETETCYLYNEYFAPAGDPALHVSSVKKAGEWIQGAMHPEEVGRDEQAGYALMGRYSKLGLNLFSVQRDVAAEITDLQEALRSGKLKVFGNLGRFWDQFLCFRRDSKGRLPEQNTALIRAMMVAWRARDKMRGPALPPKPQSRMFLETTPGNTWMKS